MKRVMLSVVVLALVCGLAVDVAWAGPGCCKSKGDAKGAKISSLTACSMGEFPHLTMLVADKEFDCPMAAEKAAEGKGAKVRFAVAGDEFDCKETAMTALADVSERYVKRYTAIAAIVDGKTIYCRDDLSGCGKAATAAAEGSGCSKSKAALASTKGKSCQGKKAELVKEEDKSEGKSCSKSKAALASAEGKGCSKSKATLARAEGSSCSKSCGKGDISCVSKAAFAEAIKAKDAKFVVLARTFDSYEDAVKARDASLEAIKVVRMKYVVEGKEVDCSSKICPAAKEAGKVEYVVGETKTKCEVMARIGLAKAQFEAAKKAADQKLAKI